MKKIFEFLKKELKGISFCLLILLIVFVNVIRVNADYMDEETEGNKKEQQLVKKIEIIHEIFPNQTDEEALFATLVHRGNITDYIEESYDESFNEKSYEDNFEQMKADINNVIDNAGQSLVTLVDLVSSAFECLFEGASGDSSDDYNEDCIMDKLIEKYSGRITDVSDSSLQSAIKKPQAVDLLTAATIVMLDSSSWTGNYSDDNYKKALAGEGLVGNMFDKNDFFQNMGSIAMNNVFCTIGGAVDIGLSWFNPGFTFDDGGNFIIQENAMAYKLSRYYTMSNICKLGFIGGTYEHVKNPDLSTDKGKEQYQKKKDVVAQEIINLAKQYRNEGGISNVCLTGNTQAGDFMSMSPQEFIDFLGPIAQADYSRTNVFASLTIAQAILESGWGKSELAQNYNNLFGITCGTWNNCVFLGDREWRIFGSIEESLNNHSETIMNESLYPGALTASSSEEQINMIAETYAPSSDGNTNYAGTVISLINQYNLTKWDVKVNTTSSLDNCSPIGNNGWTIRTVKPTQDDDAFVQSTETAHNTGQCVWYARGRALEIVEELRTNGRMTDEDASKISNLLKKAYGDGGQIYDNAKSVFNGSSNIREPKAGSYIVWKKPGDYGHVAIVEDVTDTTITLTEGSSTGGGEYSCNSDWSCVIFDGPTTYELEDFYNNYGAHRDGRYEFSGYIYFLEPLE